MRLSRHVVVVLGLLLLHQHCEPSTATSFIQYRAGRVQSAASHEQWAHIVKRSAHSARHSKNMVDDTAHIVNMQDYYRSILDEGWEGHDRDLLGTVQRAMDQGRPLTEVTIQSIQNSGPMTKPVPGRYIVLLQSGTDDQMLDSVMAVMQGASRISGGKIRATHMTPLRHAGKGLTATLNKKAVDLVSV